jgi:heme-degrading monooxygenase HmoA
MGYGCHLDLTSSKCPHAGDADEFIAAWERSRDYLKTFPAHIETALHQSLHDAQFRFVNIAHWTSEDEFSAAAASQGFRETASDLRWPFHPALYQVVRTG